MDFFSKSNCLQLKNSITKPMRENTMAAIPSKIVLKTFLEERQEICFAIHFKKRIHS